jgi:hypothetical protein
MLFNTGAFNLPNLVTLLSLATIKVILGYLYLDMKLRSTILFEEK